MIVEGNFDVIALHQSGVDHCIAPMGTALTESQAKLLSRLLGEDGHVVLMLDGDRAGRAATMKDIFLFTEASLRDMATLTSGNLDVRIARLPDGEDPIPLRTRARKAWTKPFARRGQQSTTSSTRRWPRPRLRVREGEPVSWSA